MLVAIAVILPVATSCAGAGRTVGGSTWHLIWSDEFNGRSLDAAKWNAENVATPRNGEFEYYIPKNVSVRDGSLSLISRRASYGGLAYTSAAVDTFRKFSFTYGKVVIRARLPQMGQGIWPALWMLGTGCNPVVPCRPWPAEGANEIDILEAVNTPSKIYMTPHYGPQPGENIGPESCTYSGVDFSANYHTFSAVWQPGGRIEWFVDGRSRCHWAAPGYFDGPMYLIMNTAIGGTYPGPPDSSTRFPQRFQVDYVRVYQE
ncbi:MAG: glycoside hydrolase family 16 protein [Micrococcales bacterium]|nr:glycoside hydrolase family 16 protein [Micrococcales bacterium]